MYEAQQQLRFNEFIETLDETTPDNVCSLLITMKEAFQEERLKDFIQFKDVDVLITNYETFVAESSAKSKTFAYWNMYIKMIGNWL